MTLNPSEPLPPPDHLDSIVGDFSARIDLKATPAEQHQQAARLAEELGLTGEQFREVLNLLGLPESPATPASFAGTISHAADRSAHPIAPGTETLFEPDESANRTLPDAPDSPASDLADPGDRTVTEAPTERTLFEGDTSDSSPSSLQDPTRNLFGLDELEPLAQGGMGQILRGVDPKLGRQVALKVILPEVRGSQRIREKFLNEARITSQLEHPGIIPVHKLGLTTDGRDYFTMKLVRGTTLEQALHELRDREDPKAVLRARPQLLRHFLKICDALALAHSRQVIHRDLKPENIMIGEFGEVLVMDWGLAKFLDETEPSPQAEPSTMNLPSVPTATLDGQVQGTPSYMSPEQVEGKIDVIDQKSDIYALGTILYEILCLERAFAGRKITQIFARIMAGRFTSPRERSPHLGIPHELEAVTLKAMASDPAMRYADVPQLQGDIQAFLDGRILQAARYNPLQWVGKWVSRNRTLCMTATATILLSSLLLGVSQWQETQNRKMQFQQLIQRSHALLQNEPEIDYRKRREIVDKSTGLEYRESTADKKTRQTILKSYLASARLLEQALRLKPHHPATRQKIIEVIRDAGNIALWGRDYLLARESFERLEVFHHPQSEIETLLQEVTQSERRLLTWRELRLKKILSDLKRGRFPEKNTILDDYIFETVTYRDPQTASILGNELDQMTQRVKNSSENRLANTWSESERNLITFTCTVLGRLHLPPCIPYLQGWMGVVNDPQLAIVAGQALCNSRDSAALNPLIEARARLGINSATWRAIRKSVPKIPLPSSMGFNIPDPAKKWRQQGLLFSMMDEHQKAINAFNRAIQNSPQFVHAYLDRGYSRLKLENRSGALEDFNKVIELDPKNADGFMNRGIIHDLEGNDQKALQDFTHSLQLDPKNLSAYLNRAHLLREIGTFDSAISDYNHIIQISPKNIEAFIGRGRTHQLTGNLSQAEIDISHAITLESENADAYFCRGVTRFHAKDYTDSISDLTRALQIDPKRAEAFRVRGWSYAALGKLDAAITDYSQAIQLAPSSAPSYCDRALAWNQKGNRTKAIQDSNAAIRIAPSSPRPHIERGVFHREGGDLKKALADFNRALQLNPGLAKIHVNRGLIFHLEKDFEKAVECYTRAIKIDPRYPNSYYYRALANHFRGAPKKAIEDFSRTLEIEPRHSDAYLNRGHLLMQQGAFTEARYDMKKVIELRPNYWKAWYNIGSIDTELGNFKTAIEAFKNALQNAPAKNRPEIQKKIKILETKQVPQNR